MGSYSISESKPKTQEPLLKTSLNISTIITVHFTL